MSAEEFENCMQSLSKYFRKMKHEDKVKFCRNYADIASTLKMRPGGRR